MDQTENYPSDELTGMAAEIAQVNTELERRKRKKTITQMVFHDGKIDKDEAN